VPSYGGRFDGYQRYNSGRYPPSRGMLQNDPTSAVQLAKERAEAARLTEQATQEAARKAQEVAMAAQEAARAEENAAMRVETEARQYEELATASEGAQKEAKKLEDALEAASATARPGDYYYNGRGENSFGQVLQGAYDQVQRW
jgi:hypothetical protein